MFFEDFVVGTKAEFGNYAVTREEVLEFARKYDPQPFHLSDVAAADTIFGRLAASGWHSCAMAMRMLVDHLSTIPGWQAGASGAMGIDALRFHKPVYPGDTLRCMTEVTGTRESASMPALGIIQTRLTLFNQLDEKVLSFSSAVLHRRRPPG